MVRFPVAGRQQACSCNMCDYIIRQGWKDKRVNREMDSRRQTYRQTNRRVRTDTCKYNLMGKQIEKIEHSPLRCLLYLVFVYDFQCQVQLVHCVCHLEAAKPWFTFLYSSVYSTSWSTWHRFLTYPSTSLSGATTCLTSSVSSLDGRSISPTTRASGWIGRVKPGGATKQPSVSDRTTKCWWLMLNSTWGFQRILQCTHLSWENSGIATHWQTTLIFTKCHSRRRVRNLLCKVAAGVAITLIISFSWRLFCCWLYKVPMTSGHLPPGCGRNVMRMFRTDLFVSFASCWSVWDVWEAKAEAWSTQEDCTAPRSRPIWSSTISRKWARSTYSAGYLPSSWPAFATIMHPEIKLLQLVSQLSRADSDVLMFQRGRGSPSHLQCSPDSAYILNGCRRISRKEYYAEMVMPYCYIAYTQKISMHSSYSNVQFSLLLLL